MTYHPQEYRDKTGKWAKSGSHGSNKHVSGKNTTSKGNKVVAKGIAQHHKDATHKVAAGKDNSGKSLFSLGGLSRLLFGKKKPPQHKGKH